MTLLIINMPCVQLLVIMRSLIPCDELPNRAVITAGEDVGQTIVEGCREGVLEASADQLNGDDDRLREEVAETEGNKLISCSHTRSWSVIIKKGGVI